MICYLQHYMDRWAWLRWLHPGSLGSVMVSALAQKARGFALETCSRRNFPDFPPPHDNDNTRITFSIHYIYNNNDTKKGHCSARTLGTDTQAPTNTPTNPTHHMLTVVTMVTGRHLSHTWPRCRHLNRSLCKSLSW